LQVTFGEDLNGDLSPEHYVPANAIANMANVVSVHVALLIRSDQPMNQKLGNKIYRLAGENAGPFADKHARRVFSGTVRLRNCLRNSC